MPDNGNTQRYRIEQLEKNYDQLDGKIDTIMTNHLPHIMQELIGMKTRINVLTAVNIGAIILGIIVSKILP